MSEAAALPRHDRETRSEERAGVVLVGQPNVGKSALFGALTGSYVTVSNYPGTTVEITTGSMTLGGRKIQVIDTPPVTAEHVPPGFPGLWRSADALIVVSDVSSDSVLEDIDTCLNHLAERNIELVDGPRQLPQDPGATLQVPGFVFANKVDVAGAASNLDMVRELFDARVRIEPLSTTDPESWARIKNFLVGA